MEVGLHLDGDLVTELLGLDDSEDLPPIGLENSLVNCNDFLLIENLLLELITVFLDDHFVKFLLHLVELLVLDITTDVFGTGFG